MQSYLPEQFGYFLDFDLWEDALDLLDFQVEYKKSNRHFNTSSMFYYERLGKSVKALRRKKYYEERIASNLFYGLTTEFAMPDYLVPKPGLGVRSYKFFTYPMRTLYYAIGLYFMKVTQDFLSSYFMQRTHIKSFWGGNLSFQNGRLVKIKGSKIYYKNYYSEFRRLVLKEKDENTDDKVIIKLDIQNYFEEISHFTLLELIDQNTKTSIKREYKYDIHSKQQIDAFLGFISNSSDGIPQLDNDILSSFIGYLYLTYGDLAIDDEIKSNSDKLLEYKIYRYIDDIYISITFKGAISRKDRQDFINTLGYRLADLLYQYLGLRLNTKTRYFWLARSSDKEDFVKSIKKVSREEQISEDDTNLTPQEKIEALFKQIKDLKKTKVGTLFDYEKTPEEDVLKVILDEDVNQLLAQSEYQAKIFDLFQDFDFDLVKASPLTITILIVKDSVTRDRFREYLLNLVYVTTREANLILKFLCQTGFNDKLLFRKLKENSAMEAVVDLWLKPKLDLQHPGYYQLDQLKVVQLRSHLNITEQIRLRVSNEKQRNYSVALNHLLNEFHAICWVKDQSRDEHEFKNYKAPSVEKFIASLNIPHQDCILIRHLFDRRNETQVSHPGSPQQPSQAVAEQEYIMYFSAVGRCLEQIL